MKNIMLGIVGLFMLLYIGILQSGMIQIYARENEIANCLSEVLERTLQNHYSMKQTQNDEIGLVSISRKEGENLSLSEIKNQIEEDITLRLGSDSTLRIEILVCDMEKGILSVRVEEGFILPLGRKSIVEGHKTVVVDSKAA